MHICLNLNVLRQVVEPLAYTQKQTFLALAADEIDVIRSPSYVYSISPLNIVKMKIAPYQSQREIHTVASREAPRGLGL